MTKLECIQNYNIMERLATWQETGRQEITEKTTYFAENTIYRLRVNSKDLSDALVFCKEELICKKSDPQLNWSQATTLGSLTDPEGKPISNLQNISFGNHIISPNFVYILHGDAVRDYSEDTITQFIESHGFTPYEVDNESAKGSVIISQKDYGNCLKCLGYPFLQEDELEYSREDILDLAIKPALEEYFHWLPIERIETYPVSGGEDLIPYPEDAYDVLGVSVQQRGAHGSGNITNTLLRYFDEASYGSFNYSGMTGQYRGTYRPHTMSTAADNYVTSRQLAQAQLNLNTRVHFETIYDTDPITKTRHPVLKLYSNKLGEYNIHWAIHSLNFDDIEYQQRQNVIKYCQAEVMLLFANLRRQAKTDIPGAVDYSSWIDEAKAMKQEVVDDWKQLVKASSIIRGSL